MKFALGNAFNTDEMLMNFPIEKLKSHFTLFKKVFKTVNKYAVVSRLFIECFSIVILDIIDNNVTFELPLVGTKKADIHMLIFEGNDFKRARKYGKFKDVDFLSSWFTGYLLYFYMYGKRVRKKPIYVNNRLKNIITKNTNDGKTYC